MLPCGNAALQVFNLLFQSYQNQQVATAKTETTSTTVIQPRVDIRRSSHGRDCRKSSADWVDRARCVPPSAHRRALKRKLAGLRGKLTVVKWEIAEIQAQENSTTDNPGLFGQQSPSHPGLRALQDRERQLEHVIEQLEKELRGK